MQNYPSKKAAEMKIDVDFEVFKAITVSRPSEAVSINDVLREKFGLGKVSQAGDGLWAKGMYLPAGTELTATWHGQPVNGLVKKQALWVKVDGREQAFATLSGAAKAVAGCNVNGWAFWSMTDSTTGKQVKMGAWKKRAGK